VTCGLDQSGWILWWRWWSIRYGSCVVSWAAELLLITHGGYACQVQHSSAVLFSELPAFFPFIRVTRDALPGSFSSRQTCGSWNLQTATKLWKVQSRSHWRYSWKYIIIVNIGVRLFNTANTKARNWSRTWVSSIQSRPRNLFLQDPS
jgi:hypothetical protein